MDIAQDRSTKLGTVEQQVNFLEDKITDWHHMDQKRFVLLKERLNTYLQYVDCYRQDRDYEEQAFANELTALESKMAQKFSLERQADLEMEKRLN